MIISASIASLLFRPVPFLFDGMDENQANTKVERILATSEVFTTNGSLKTDYILDVERPNRWKLTVKQNPAFAFEEVYYYDLGKEDGVCVIYRPKTKQFIQSTAPASNLTQFINTVTPKIDEFLIILATQNGFDTLREKLDISNKKWTAITKNGQTSLKYKQDDGTTEIEFPKSSLRPADFTFVNMSGVIKWHLKYEHGANMQNPAGLEGSYEVVQFDDMLGKGKATSPAAEKTLNTLFAHYDKPKALGYIATSGQEKVTVQYTPQMVYQSDEFATWQYDGRELKLYNKKLKTSYVGTATGAELIDYVARTGSRIEVLLRSLILGRNPYRLLLNDYTTVSTSSGTGASESANWIVGKTSMFELKFAVAKRDGFVLKVESQPKTVHGDTLPKTVTTYARKTGAIPKEIAPTGTKQVPISQMP